MKKTYQVRHLNDWMQSRIDSLLHGKESEFPKDYEHIANVQANGLREVASLATTKGAQRSSVPISIRSPRLRARRSPLRASSACSPKPLRRLHIGRSIWAKDRTDECKTGPIIAD
jgi:hypothetical protein